MTSNKSVQESPIVSHDCARDAIRRQLNTAINIERRFTAEQLATESGVSLSAIRSYMRNEGAKEPCLANALSIAVVIGPRAVSAIMALIGYSAAPLDEPEAIQPMQILSDALNHLSIIGQAAADNRIDHVEKPRTTEAADMLIATVLPLSSAGAAE